VAQCVLFPDVQCPASQFFNDGLLLPQVVEA
jgi:hypothetical protein